MRELWRMQRNVRISSIYQMQFILSKETSLYSYIGNEVSPRPRKCSTEVTLHNDVSLLPA